MKASLWATIRLIAVVCLAVGSLAGISATAAGAQESNKAAELRALKFLRGSDRFDTNGLPGLESGQLSKVQIERFRCESSGNPSAAVDISCNTEEYGQDYAPDNEITIAVNPGNPNHLVAGSNDYFYRFNNATGARQAIVPTGFFTSFDGGATWTDGQIPMRSGNGAGDPSVAFDRKNDVVLMAQLENTGGLGSTTINTQGDVSVSRSTDGGRTWSEPITVMKGNGAALGPASNSTFYDKEWLTVDNNPGSPFFGRAYVTATSFLWVLRGRLNYESPIVLSYSDDGGLTWSEPREISGSNPTYCTYQDNGPAGECDEDQFSIPEVAPDGTLYVHFLNGQNAAAWEVPFDFDDQIMVIRSTDGGSTFSNPVPAAQLEDGLTDLPFSVIARQTVWGHQIRWTAAGNISVDPTDPLHLTVVFSDRGTPNPNARPGCFDSPSAPNYDPCNAGPGSDLSIYRADSFDGGVTWGNKQVVENLPGHAWFPWADHKADGTLAVAWDQDTAPAPADNFVHVLKVGAAPAVALGPLEHPDVSVTHWSGQYVPQSAWPVTCGPTGYSDPPVANAEGKDCNVFHGDYTGLAVGPDGSVNVVWTGLNQWAVSPQVDPYTGGLHDGYRQDAMFARR